MKAVNIVLTFLAVAMVAMPELAFADRLQLKSGSVLVGKIVGTDGDTLKFADDDLGVVAVPLAALMKAEDAAAKPIPAEELPVIPKEPETWHGSVNAGFQATRGNTYENSGSVLANLNRRWEKDRVNFDFGYYYSEDAVNGADVEKTEDRWNVEAKHDHFWFEKVYSYENFKWERDEIQELSARYRLGIGGGYQWLDNTDFAATGKWSFNQEFGVNWVKEKYSHDDDDAGGDFFALRYGHHLNYLPKWAEGLEFFHSMEVLPDAADWEKFLANADVGFTTKLIWDLDLIAKIEWEYNSRPVNNRKKNDTRYIIGLGYKW